ncbi:hypothetical protein DFH07DRAFT_959144 [Mycena maculata]|uniref:Retrotransposon gag domain-containing protein n=1 Tax=Mycena maculata TaxID=230809 RepID=A0AAD7NDV5_9AGAR|nr:hypothetical protein DFH07DRAFT_959144 [Mycena maculata]
MDNNNNIRVTRAATHDGRHPAPKPLYSPQAFAFGTIEAGALYVLLDAPTVALASRPTTASAVRPTSASSEEDLITLRTPSPLTLGGRENSSALPSLTMSNVDAGMHDKVSAPGEDGGWTPQNIVGQYLTLKAQREASENAQDGTEVNVIMDAPSAKVQDLVPSSSPVPMSSRRRATVEEVEDEEDLISFTVIPSTAKGKGPDPGNWGGISAFQNFSKREMNVQRDTLMAYEEAKRMEAEEESVPTDFLVDLSPTVTSTPRAKTSRKRLKSPKMKKVAEASAAPAPVVKATAVAGPAPAPAAKVQFVETEPKKTGTVPVAPGRDDDRVTQTVPSMQEILQLLSSKMTKLQAQVKASGSASLKSKGGSGEQQANVSSASRTHPTPPLPRGVTPGRLAAENFFRRQHGAAPITRTMMNLDIRDAGHQARDYPLNVGVVTSVSGELCFAREARTYVKMGRVPMNEQAYFVSYYLDGRALDFYNQVVAADEASWDLERFFIELFEFCFPADFRNKQRKRLERCYQGSKDVATHVAEWSEIYNTIGLEDTQEKIVKLFNSFTYAIQGEIYRKDVDPETATWDEVVKAAEQAEILLKLVTPRGTKPGPPKRPNQPVQGSSSDHRP